LWKPPKAAGSACYDGQGRPVDPALHEYRDAVGHAKFEGDGRGLRKFKNVIIITYDGPRLPNYDNKGVRIYPLTSLRQILKLEAAMSGLQKAQYEADINDRHVKAAA
jgi:hypothetical protein